jgi:RNA polymerase sigma factor (TIGR02999 family)
MSEMTTLLVAANQGDSKALDQLFADCYPELRRLAHARMQGNHAVTLLDTTALVHESYCRFLNAGQLQITDRSHFMAYAARVMRSIIIDGIRARSSRGLRVDLGTDLPAPISRGESEILHVHEALEELALISERLVRVVEMRYFAGMTEAEIGEALGITERTVRRDWDKARMLLAATLT